MSKRRNPYRVRVSSKQLQQLTEPPKPVGWRFWALVTLCPLGGVYIGVRHHSLLMGPKNYEEAGILALFTLCSLGTSLLLLKLSSRLENLGGWARKVAVFAVRACFCSAVAVGFGVLAVVLSRGGSDSRFSTFTWGLGLLMGCLFLGSLLFGESKSRLAKFLFTVPDPKPRPKWWPWPLRWWG